MQSVLKWSTAGVLTLTVAAMALFALWPGATVAEEDDGAPEGTVITHGSGFGDAGFLEDVAERLDISADELRDAIEEVAEERLIERIQQRVADGSLTQEEADEFIDAMQSGSLGELMHERFREHLSGHLEELPERLREHLSEQLLDRLPADFAEMLEQWEDGTLKSPFPESGTHRGSWFHFGDGEAHVEPGESRSEFRLFPDRSSGFSNGGDGVRSSSEA